MMRRVLLIAGVIVGVALLVVAGIFAASESGEVIVLTTYDDAGAPHATRIWVVDDGGAQWLRSGIPTNGWYQRLRAHPEVEVRRGDRPARYRAVAVETPAARDRVHALMAAKYGLADRYIGLTRDGSRSIAVRLDPL
jgi:hypothetical protein